MSKEINNNVIGNVVEGSLQVAGEIIYNYQLQNEPEVKPSYAPEPLWRSNITLAVLSWISCLLGILGMIPIGKMIQIIVNIFNGSCDVNLAGRKETIWAIIFGIIITILIACLQLRRVTKYQVRYPIFCNLAVCGLGKRISVERIHAGKCPKCGGEMRYYNKPIEWIDKPYSDGKTRREITKRRPVLECKRNRDHFYIVDSAEDKVG